MDVKEYTTEYHWNDACICSLCTCSCCKPFDIAGQNILALSVYFFLFRNGFLNVTICHISIGTNYVLPAEGENTIDTPLLKRNKGWPGRQSGCLPVQWKLGLSLSISKNNDLQSCEYKWSFKNIHIQWSIITTSILLQSHLNKNKKARLSYSSCSN